MNTKYISLYPQWHCKNGGGLFVGRFKTNGILKIDMTADDFEFNPETYEEEITKLYRPWDYKEIPVCVKMRDITQPNSWFGVVDVILPGASPNYNKPIHCTLLGWCTANDLLVSLEYFDGHEWKPCGILK